MGLAMALVYIPASLITCLLGVLLGNRCKKFAKKEFNLHSVPRVALTLGLVTSIVVNAAVVYSIYLIYGDSDFTYIIYGLGASLITPIVFGLLLYALTIWLASNNSDFGGIVASYTCGVLYGVCVFPAILFSLVFLR